PAPHRRHHSCPVASKQAEASHPYPVTAHRSAPRALRALSDLRLQADDALFRASPSMTRFGHSDIDSRTGGGTDRTNRALNRPGIRGDSGVPWVRWSRRTGNVMPLSLVNGRSRT